MRVAAFICFLFICFLINETKALGAGSIFGVDYGTDVFKVIIMNGNTPDIVLNDQSGRKTSNLVGFDRKGERVFGSSAKTLSVKYPKRVISSAHQFLGKSYPDSSIEDSRHLFPFDLVNNNGSYAFQIDDMIYTPEEIVAMTLEFAQNMAQSTKGSRVTDLALVVPPYLTQAERMGFVNAAKIAGLNVVLLANEGTAAAVQYLRTRLLTEESANQYTIIYDVGAGHTSATLTRFSIDKLKNGTITRRIIANMTTWAEVGGRDFDYRLTQILKEKAEKQFNRDFTNNARVLAKLGKQARKAKEVLTANKEANIRIENLTDDKDFSAVLSRSELDESCSDLFEKVLQPVRAILEKTTVDHESIDVEVIGGGSRIVKINSLLEELFGDRVGRHLNGDESSLLGAAIFAATGSAGKRSSILIKDSYNHVVGAAFDIPEVEPITLFKENARLKTHKSKNVYASDDFSCDLFYGENETLSSGVPRSLGGCDISGFPDLSTYRLSEEPAVVKIRFDLDSRGLIECSEAILRVEELILPEIKEIPPVVNEEQENEEQENEVESNEDKLIEKSPETTEEPLENLEETQKQTVEGENEPTIKKKFFDLIVKRKETPNAINSTQLYASKAVLRKLREDEANRLLLAKTMNELESYVYNTLDSIETEEIRTATTPEERENFATLLSEAGEWIYEDGDGAPLSEYQEKLSSLQAIGDRIETRVKEREGHPLVASFFHEWKEATLSVLETIVTDKNVEEDERDKLVNQIRECETWLEEKQEEDAKLQPFDDPAWKASELQEKLSALEKTFKRLNRRRSRTPTPSPTPSPTVEPTDDLFEGIDFDNLNFDFPEEPVPIAEEPKEEENNQQPPFEENVEERPPHSEL